ncbi:MAG: 4Fe-4S dicluster domain-containing protein [Desulfovibrio sp.]|jgi:formate hydrogenlyase subunit 6/NADH:ubiquinone oxidoreductase subunit I|nr:4Fe-4S dicluster domain-containing protein [Desulfovibrio sp.]
MNFLRPPGVFAEKDLRARCIACGKCAQVCNNACIRLMPDSPFGPETPKVFHRTKPCILCMKCGEICPTNALRKVSVKQAGMGFAELDRGRCVNYRRENPVMCWTCYERCPLKAEAIVLKGGRIPAVTEICVGCGVCEYVCPVDAIHVTPSRRMKNGGSGK